MIATGRSNPLLNDVAKVPQPITTAQKAVKTALVLDRCFPLKIQCLILHFTSVVM